MTYTQIITLNYTNNFEFDWFFRTLSASDIQKRCDALIDAIRNKESELEKTKSKQDGKSSSVL